MKNLIQNIFLLSGILLLASCSKNLEERNLQFAALNPARMDADAGLWKPILLTAANEFAVAAPAAITSPGYIAELNEIKGWQRNLTAAQKASIQFWSAGAVLRWNEILRELVACADETKSEAEIKPTLFISFAFAVSYTNFPPTLRNASAPV